MYTYSIGKTLEALEIFISKNDVSNLALAFNNLAFNFFCLGDFDFQREYLIKAIEIYKSEGYLNGLIKDYNNLGVSLKNTEKYEEAMHYYELAYEELKSLNSPFLMAQNLTNRANILEKLGDYSAAERFFFGMRRYM